MAADPPQVLSSWSGPAVKIGDVVVNPGLHRFASHHNSSFKALPRDPKFICASCAQDREGAHPARKQGGAAAQMHKDSNLHFKLPELQVLKKDSVGIIHRLNSHTSLVRFDAAKGQAVTV